MVRLVTSDPAIMLGVERVVVVGGGLAGSEAAWQVARLGVPVLLHEMRPARPTPVHRTGHPAGLVCSNPLKSLETSTPHGLLKREMEALGSLVLREALAGLARFAAAAGQPVLDWCASPIAGADGNREFFLHLGKGGSGDRSSEICSAIDAWRPDAA